MKMKYNEEMSMLDAFCALKDIDDDDLPKLREAKSFPIYDQEAMRQAKELKDAKEEDKGIEVIDVDADVIEHLKKGEDYLGQAILSCNKCKSNMFIDMDSLVPCSEVGKEDYFNVEEECPHCKAKGFGFKLLGQVGKVGGEEKEEETENEPLPSIHDQDQVEEEPKEEDSEEEPKEESEPEDNEEEIEIEEKPEEFSNDAEDGEVKFDNDVEETPEDELPLEDTSISHDSTDAEEEGYNDDDLDLPVDDEEEINPEETEVHEDEVDSEVEEDKNKYDDVDDDQIKEALEDGNVLYQKRADEAWMMNRVMQAMNDEEAYYSWIYIWPDGESKQDCYFDFGEDEENFEDLKAAFKRNYKAYHEDGLFDADPEVLEYARKMDDELGLAPIENLLDEELKDKEPLKEDYHIEKVKDFVNIIIDPERIDSVVIHNETDLKRDIISYEGNFENIPEYFMDATLLSFTVGNGNLILNVDLNLQGAKRKVNDIIDYLDDINTTKSISIWDTDVEEEIFKGSPKEVLQKYGDIAVVSIDCPERLELYVEGDDSKTFLGVYEDEYEEYWDNEPFDDELENGPYKDLEESIFKANDLVSYRANKPQYDEYWIREALKTNENLKEIYEGYVKGHGKELVSKFKKVTGYKDAIDEAYESMNETAPRNDDQDEAIRKAKEEVKSKKAYAVIYGYHGADKHGMYSFYELDNHIICKNGKELENKTKEVMKRYKPSGSIHVIYNDEPVTSVNEDYDRYEKYAYKDYPNKDLVIIHEDEYEEHLVYYNSKTVYSKVNGFYGGVTFYFTGEINYNSISIDSDGAYDIDEGFSLRLDKMDDADNIELTKEDACLHLNIDKVELEKLINYLYDKVEEDAVDRYYEKEEKGFWDDEPLDINLHEGLNKGFCSSKCQYLYNEKQLGIDLDEFRTENGKFAGTFAIWQGDDEEVADEDLAYITIQVIGDIKFKEDGRLDNSSINSLKCEMINQEDGTGRNLSSDEVCEMFDLTSKDYDDLIDVLEEEAIEVLLSHTEEIEVDNDIDESIKSFKDRAELSEAIQKCKEQKIKYQIRKSIKEGYRYDLIQEALPAVRDDVEQVEGEVVDPIERSTSTAVADPESRELVDKLMRISRDISNSIQNHYGIQADQRLILADLIQDLRLVSGNLRPEELADTPMNQLTKEMYAAYDDFLSELGATQEQKIQVALATLDSDQFSPEVIDANIGSPRFIQAARRGNVPFISRQDIRRLRTNESFQNIKTNGGWRWYITEDLNLDSKYGQEFKQFMLSYALNDDADFKDLIKSLCHCIQGYCEEKNEPLPTPEEAIKFIRHRLGDNPSHDIDEVCEEEFAIQEEPVEENLNESYDNYKLKKSIISLLDIYDNGYPAEYSDEEIIENICKDLIEGCEENGEELPSREQVIQILNDESLFSYYQIKEIVEEFFPEVNEELCEKCGHKLSECSCSEEIDVDKFKEELDEYFDNAYEDTVVFEATKGSYDKKGNVLIEGIIKMDEVKRPVKFLFTKSKRMNESIEETYYVVTNNLSDEKFEFSM